MKNKKTAKRKIEYLAFDKIINIFFTPSAINIDNWLRHTYVKFDKKGMSSIRETWLKPDSYDIYQVLYKNNKIFNLYRMKEKKIPIKEIAKTMRVLCIHGWTLVDFPF